MKYPQLYNYIQSLNPMKPRGKRGFILGDRHYYESTAYKALDRETLLKEFNINPEFLCLDRKEQHSIFTDIVEDIIREKEKEERNKFSLKKKGLPEWPEELWTRLFPVQDIETGKSFLFDESNSEISFICYEAFKSCAPPELRKNRPILPCLSLYNPLTLDKSWVRPLKEHTGKYNDDYPTLFVNRHVAPEWRFTIIEGVPKCPELIEKFLDHLFPNKQCKRYLLNWIRNSILEERNGTYLVLNAAKGVGKNLFVDIIKELVGERNFSKVNRGFFDSQFNSLLEDKRLILIDEQAINTPERIDRVKDYINPEQNIEKKGVDANSVTITYNSFIICNNRETDIKLDHDDRRFSVMEMTNVPLKKVFSLEDIVALDKIKEYPDMIAEFGHWILKECKAPEYDIETPWKGERFSHLVEVSLWEWQKFILDKVLSREETEYDFKILQMEYKKYRTSTKSSFSRDRLKSFLDEYIYEGGPLGKLEKEGKEYILIPDKRFLPETDEEENITEFSPESLL